MFSYQRKRNPIQSIFSEIFQDNENEAVLLAVVAKTAAYLSGTGDRKNNNMIRSCTTSNDFQKQLINHGYHFITFAFILIYLKPSNPLVVTAENMQSAILMHIEYRRVSSIFA